MSQKNNIYLNYLHFDHAVPRQWTYYTLQSNVLRQELYTLIVAFTYWYCNY